MAGLTRLVCLLLSVLVLAACGTTKQLDFTGRTVDPPFVVDARPLTSDRGKTVSLGSDDDAPQLRLVLFGYTHCPDICPTVLGSLASGLVKLSKGDRERVRTYFVTSDPERDTTAVLSRYLKRFDPSFRGLTGSIGDIAAVGESMGIYVDVGPFETVAEQPPQGPRGGQSPQGPRGGQSPQGAGGGQSPQGARGGYDPNSHSTYLVAVGKDGEVPVFWDAETSPSQFASDIRFLLHGEN